MSPAEQSAVTRAAKRMAAWYAAHRTTDSRGKDALQTGENGRTRATPKDAAPDWPIVELRERGAIDGAREAKLTAEAYAMSVQLRDNHLTEG